MEKTQLLKKHNLREIHGKLRQSVLYSATADHTSSRTIATVHVLHLLRVLLITA